MQKGTKEKKKLIQIKNKYFDLQKEWFLYDKKYRLLCIIFCLVIFALTEVFENSVLGNKVLTKVINSGVLSLFTVLLADLFINGNYNKHLKNSLYEIITNTKLLENFIDKEYKYEIMKTSMLANLGSKTTEALYESIIKSYKETILRNDYKFYINITKSDNDDYYNANINIIFTIPPHKEILNMFIFASHNEDEIQSKMNEIEEKDIQLFFPMLLAKSDSENNKNSLKFEVTAQIDAETVLSEPNNGNRYHKIYLIQPRDTEAFIEIIIDTVLNKSENFFQEDIFCIHNGYHLSLTFDKDLIRKCKCYHSCKAKDLSVTTNQNSIIIHTPGVLLPENNFVFIWEGEK